MNKSRQITRAHAELNILRTKGQLIYQTSNQILELRNVVRTWIEALGVEVVFDRRTPPDIKDYLVGAGIGAVEGACAGALVGLIFGVMLDAPGTGLAVGAGLGATMGAAAGVNAVNGGYRVRIHAWRAAGGVVARVEVI